MYSNGTLLSTVDIYDTATQSWNSTTGGVGNLSVPRFAPAAGSAGSKIIFAGGSSFTGLFDTVDIYDIVTGLWNSTALGAGSLSIARGSLAGAGAASKIVFGGGNSASGAVNTVDIYDTNTNMWISTATGAGSLSVARYGLVAAATSTRIIFAGG